MSKKNLDKLFQEKLKDFEEIPEERVWDSISQSLDKKRKRRLIPIWWKLGGVAALLVVLFVVINPFENTTDIVPVISDINKPEPNNTKETYEGSDTISSEESVKEQNQVAETEAENSRANSNALENQETDETKISPTTKNQKFKSPLKTNTGVAETTTYGSSKKIDEQGEVIVYEASENDIPNTIESGNKVTEISKENEIKTLEKNIDNEIVNAEKTSAEALAAVDSKKVEEKIDASKGKSIFEEIEKNEDEEEALAETPKSRWSVGANVAPVYFSSFGQGSPIDPVFNTNTKSGDVNMSYGLSFAYQLSEKLRVRSGINKVDYGYDTNEVEFSASVQGALASRLNNVDYAPSAQNVVIENKANDFLAFAESKSSADVIAGDISRSGAIAQGFGYIEVPVELDYALIDNRFGFHLIGGLSSMFLTNNSIVLNDSNETIELGEANNINTMNFSTNIGFGLNYKFTPAVRLNVEPVFKYQLNTFSSASGNFNPFSIGVYSGLNFRF